MGLHLYVGAMTRFYARRWENVIQQAAREMGMQYDEFTADGSPQEPPPSIETAAAWTKTLRNWIARNIGQQVSEPIDWNELETDPYFTDKVSAEGAAALKLLAAHDDHPEFPAPSHLSPDWQRDPAYSASAQPKATTRYRQILMATLWIPCRFSFVYRPEDAELPHVGSVFALSDQLRSLNERTFRGSAADLTRWRKENLGDSPDCARAAKFALAVYTQLAEEATAHRLPMTYWGV